MNYFIEIDLFYFVPQINIKGKSKFPTLFGAVATLIFIIFSILLTLFYSSNIINKTNPIYRAQEYSTRDSPFYDYGSEQIIPAISFLGELDNKTLSQAPFDDTLFKLKFFLAKYNYESNILTGEKVLREVIENFEDEPCTEKLFSRLINDRDYSDFLFRQTKISEFRCLKSPDSRRINITGSWGETEHIFFGAVLGACDNKTVTGGKVCKPKEVIQNNIEQGLFQIGILQGELNFEDYYKPIKKVFNPQWVKAARNTTKIIEIVIRKSKKKKKDK